MHFTMPASMLRRGTTHASPRIARASSRRSPTPRTCTAARWSPRTSSTSPPGELATGGSRSRTRMCARASSNAAVTRSPRLAGSSPATGCAPPTCCGCTRGSPNGSARSPVRCAGQARRCARSTARTTKPRRLAARTSSPRSPRSASGRDALRRPYVSRARRSRRLRRPERSSHSGRRARSSTGRSSSQAARPRRDTPRVRWRSSAVTAMPPASRQCSTTWAASPTGPAAGRMRSRSIASGGDAAARAGDVVLAAFSDCNVGELRSDQGRLEEAEPLLRRALQVWRGTADEHGVAFATALLGRLHARAGRDDQAVELLEDALARFRALGVELDAALVEVLQAEAALFAGRADDARERALRLMAELNGDALLGPLLHHVAGAALAQLGDAGAAEHALRGIARVARAAGLPFETSWRWTRSTRLDPHARAASATRCWPRSASCGSRRPRWRDRLQRPRRSADPLVVAGVVAPGHRDEPPGHRRLPWRCGRASRGPWAGRSRGAAARRIPRRPDRRRSQTRAGDPLCAVNDRR